MFVLVLLGLVASAKTATWYDPFDYNKGFQDNMNRLWDNFNRQMYNLEDNIENIVQHSKNLGSKSRIDGNEYKISIYLTGFNMEDIVVNVNKGSLVIQAVHSVPGEPADTYLYVTDLPDFVDKNGSWYYYNDILTIVFPIKQRESDGKTESTLPYGNDKPDKNNDPDEDVLREDLDNSYNTDKLETTSASSQYDYEDAIHSPQNDVDNL